MARPWRLRRSLVAALALLAPACCPGSGLSVHGQSDLAADRLALVGVDRRPGSSRPLDPRSPATWTLVRTDAPAEPSTRRIGGAMPANPDASALLLEQNPQSPPQLRVLWVERAALAASIRRESPGATVGSAVRVTTVSQVR